MEQFTVLWILSHLLTPLAHTRTHVNFVFNFIRHLNPVCTDSFDVLLLGYQGPFRIEGIQSGMVGGRGVCCYIRI